MYKYTLCILISILSYGLYGQQTAITLDGDTVYIYDDGTWSYDTDHSPTSDDTDFLSAYEVMDSSRSIITIPSDATANKSKVGDGYKLFVNDNNWKRVPVGTINPEADYCFISKDASECYAMIIHEDPEIGTLSLYNVAMENAKVATNKVPSIINSDYVVVNGTEMIKVIYKIEISGLDLTFISLYHSGKNGSVQYTCWTYSNIFEKNKEILEQMLAGLDINKE